MSAHRSPAACFTCFTGPLHHQFARKFQQASPRYSLPLLLEQQLEQSPKHPSAAVSTPKQDIQQSQTDPQLRSDTRVLQPKHRALAARLAAATERQQRRQQFQQKQNSLSLPQHSSRNGALSSKTAADIALVCEEIGLPSSVAAVLTTAAAKGSISRNPGVLLPQVSNALRIAATVTPALLYEAF